MEKIHKNIHVFMLSCIKHACFLVFSPFSAYFSPHDIIAEKGLLLRRYLLNSQRIQHEPPPPAKYIKFFMHKKYIISFCSATFIKSTTLTISSVTVLAMSSLFCTMRSFHLRSAAALS